MCHSLTDIIKLSTQVPMSTLVQPKNRSFIKKKKRVRTMVHEYVLKYASNVTMVPMVSKKAQKW